MTANASYLYAVSEIKYILTTVLKITALKGSQFYVYLLLLQLVLYRVAALNNLPVHHPKCRLYFSLGPLRSARVF